MSQAFEELCHALEEASELDRLATRGTVRLALRAAGLEADNVSSGELRVLVDRVLPGELASRGVEWNEALAAALLASLERVDDSGGSGDSPLAVFQRLGSAMGGSSPDDAVD